MGRTGKLPALAGKPGPKKAKTSYRSASQRSSAAKKLSPLGLAPSPPVPNPFPIPALLVLPFKPPSNTDPAQARSPAIAQALRDWKAEGYDSAIAKLSRAIGQTPKSEVRRRKERRKERRREGEKRRGGGRCGWAGWFSLCSALLTLFTCLTLTLSNSLSLPRLLYLSLLIFSLSLSLLSFRPAPSIFLTSFAVSLTPPRTTSSPPPLTSTRAAASTSPTLCRSSTAASPTLGSTIEPRRSATSRRRSRGIRAARTTTRTGLCC